MVKQDFKLRLKVSFLYKINIIFIGVNGSSAVESGWAHSLYLSG